MTFIRVAFVPRSRSYSADYNADSRLLRQIMKYARVHSEVVYLNLDKYSGPIDRVGKGYDGVCTMARNPTSLSILSCAEINGIPVVNSVSSAKACLDRVSLIARLAKKGIKIPRSFVHRRDFSDVQFPAILKNTVSVGAKGRRNIVLRSTESSRKFSAILKNGVWVSQQFLPASTMTKVYVVGDEVVSVRYETLIPDGTRAVQKSLTDHDTLDSCLECGNLLGLEVYNVELLTGPDGPFVIDVNDFPSFSGVTNAPSIISKHIRTKLRK